jgi:transposase-like protein
MTQDMAIIKLQVSVPEAVRAVSEFKQNRIKALQTISAEVKAAVASAFNGLLHAEMSLFLGQPEQADNKRNGYSEREYALKHVGAIRLKMPLDRRLRFESVVVPKSEQVDPRLKEDMAVLHLAGLSKRTLAMVSKRVLGVEVGKDTVSNSLDAVRGKALEFLTRSLQGKRYVALFIDGTNFRIQRRGSTEKEPSLVVLGLDDRHCYSVLAIESGTKDNAECWRAVFASLRERGLDMGSVRLGVMDGLPGLETAFREYFPKAQTARCWVHALRNALAKAPERLREAFKALAHKAMYAESEDAARIAFQGLQSAFGKDAQRAVRCLEKDLESLLTHYRFEKKLWRALKTTNPIERVNKELKRRTKSMETLGERTLEVLTAFTAIRLEFGWQTTPVDSARLDGLKGIKHNAIEATLDTLLH